MRKAARVLTRSGRGGILVTRPTGDTRWGSAEIAREFGIDVGHLGRIFKGQLYPQRLHTPQISLRRS